jgi:hypothetical protein
VPSGFGPRGTAARLETSQGKQLRLPEIAHPVLVMNRERFHRF